LFALPLFHNFFEPRVSFYDAVVVESRVIKLTTGQHIDNLQQDKTMDESLKTLHAGEMKHEHDTIVDRSKKGRTRV